MQRRSHGLNRRITSWKQLPKAGSQHHSWKRCYASILPPIFRNKRCCLLVFSVNGVWEKTAFKKDHIILTKQLQFTWMLFSHQQTLAFFGQPVFWCIKQNSKRLYWRTLNQKRAVEKRFDVKILINSFIVTNVSYWNKIDIDFFDFLIAIR